MAGDWSSEYLKKTQQAAAYLGELFHARQCRGNNCDRRAQCQQLFSLYHHATGCNYGKQCPIRGCMTTKRLLDHVNNCYEGSNCLMCTLVKLNPQVRRRRCYSDLCCTSTQDSISVSTTSDATQAVTRKPSWVSFGCKDRKPFSDMESKSTAITDDEYSDSASTGSNSDSDTCSVSSLTSHNTFDSNTENVKDVNNTNNPNVANQTTPTRTACIDQILSPSLLPSSTTSTLSSNTIKKRSSGHFEVPTLVPKRPRGLSVSWSICPRMGQDVDTSTSSSQ